MFKRGDVRLVAAAIAAISLHALVLMVMPSEHVMKMGNQQGDLQIELLAAQATSTDQSKSDVSKMDTSQSFVSRPVMSKASKRMRTETPKQQPEHETRQHSTAKLSPPPLPTSQSSVIATDQSNQLNQSDQSDHVTVFTRNAVQSVTEIKRQEALTANKEFVLQRSQAYLSHPPHPNTAVQAVAANNETAAAVVPRAVQTRLLAEVHYPRQARRHGWQGKAEFEFDVHQQSIQTITLLASTGYPILDRAAHRGLSAVQHVSLSNGLYRMPVVFRLQ